MKKWVKIPTKERLGTSITFRVAPSRPQRPGVHERFCEATAGRFPQRYAIYLLFYYGSPSLAMSSQTQQLDQVLRKQN